MMRQRLAYSLLLVLMLSLFSCSQKERMPEPECGGTVSICFSTVDLQTTKATTPGDGEPADGGGIAMDEGNPDLVILIANNITGHQDFGKIVMTYPGSNASREDGFTSTQTVIKFDFGDLPAGNYTVYAFGNTKGLWAMSTINPENPEGDPVQVSFSELTGLTTASQVEALKFNSQNTREGLTLQNGRLPLSAKASLTVTGGKNGEARIELLRCVAKVTAMIKNNTGDPLQLYNYLHTVMGISPDRGYVIPQVNDFTGTPGNLVADPCTKFGNPNYTIDISNEGSFPYHWYVFPSNGPYTVDIRFTLFKGNVGGTQRNYSYPALPIINWRAENIPELRRNQHLTVTTYISKGITVSFNYEVNDWETHNEYVTFD